MNDPTCEIEQLTEEGLIGMAEASTIIRRHPATVTRWVLTGVRLASGRRVRLQGFRLGGSIRTSRPAITRFIAAQQGEPAETPITTPAARRRADAAAEAVLDAAGIK